MIDSAVRRESPLGRLRDLAALGKPRLSALVLFTAAIGVWLAPRPLEPLPTGLFLLATAGLVAAANTLNCWVEREIDARMLRTRRRPLPAGRLEPRTALVFGIALGVTSLSVISWTTNLLTTALGVVALFSYVLVYTPLKRLTPWAVLVGAVPGALPPLMGWTAAAGHLALPGLYVFGVLFLWQLPHFLAISIYLQDDFRRGGIRVLPLVHGERAARAWLFAATAALALYALAAPLLGLAGPIYTVTAALLGGGWIVLAAIGLRQAVDPTWARRIFGYSLLYLPPLVALLVLDAR